MDEEQKEFQAALLRSVEDMVAGRYVQKTVVEVGVGIADQVPAGAAPQGGDD
jgi:hypothetical protein